MRGEYGGGAPAHARCTPAAWRMRRAEGGGLHVLSLGWGGLVLGGVLGLWGGSQPMIPPQGVFWGSPASLWLSWGGSHSPPFSLGGGVCKLHFRGAQDPQGGSGGWAQPMGGCFGGATDPPEGSGSGSHPTPCYKEPVKG